MFDAQARKEYERSNAVRRIDLDAGPSAAKAANRLRLALLSKDPSLVMAAAMAFADALCDGAKVPRIPVEIAAPRKRKGYAECHGRRAMSCIPVALRTTQRGRFIGFRTFLKTLCHDFCHHHDVSALGLTHSFHTKGFSSRMEALYKSILAALERLARETTPS
jgi:hypothetical protein